MQRPILIDNRLAFTFTLLRIAAKDVRVWLYKAKKTSMFHIDWLLVCSYGEFWNDTEDLKPCADEQKAECYFSPLHQVSFSKLYRHKAAHDLSFPSILTPIQLLTASKALGIPFLKKHVSLYCMMHLLLPIARHASSQASYISGLFSMRATSGIT